MPRVIPPPHLRELETMAGGANAAAQQRAGLTQITGNTPVYATSAERPTAPTEGQQIVNKQTGKLEIRYGGAWVVIASL